MRAKVAAWHDWRCFSGWNCNWMLKCDKAWRLLRKKTYLLDGPVAEFRANRDVNCFAECDCGLLLSLLFRNQYHSSLLRGLHLQP